MSAEVRQIGLQLAEEYGIPVFPCRPDKKPHTEHGFHDASCNVEQIAEWWRRWPDALIGVPTGRSSGIIVLDVDPAGLDWYREHANELAAGRIHKTRRAGFHSLYKAPAVEIKNSTSKIAAGVDVRGEGGYVVWWPGHGLEAVGELEDLTEPPAWLLEQLVAKPNGQDKSTDSPRPSVDQVGAGKRNDYLSREAYRLRRQGSSVEQIEAVLRAINQARCSPPLPDEELRQIANAKQRVEPEQLEAESAADAPLLTLLWFATLDQVAQHKHLVKGVLLVGSLFVVYGESNSGKTFWVLDLSLSVAAGQPWRGRQTERGLVIYIAGEGAASVRTRVAAYRSANPHAAPGLPFAVVPQSVNLLSADAVDLLVRTIRAAESECGAKAALVVIDTFARSIPGGDENSAEDVGIAIASADCIRAETGAAVGFIHHAGKDPTRGARGSSALRAATDTEILIEGQFGPRTASVTKQRDLECGDRMPFELTAVQVNVAHGGIEPITSCVVRHLEAKAGERRKPPTGKNQQLLLGAIREHVRSTGSPLVSTLDLVSMAKSQGIGRQRLPEARAGLVRDGWIRESVGGVSFIEGEP